MAGTPLAQRALALHSFLFVTDGAVNYNYIVANGIKLLTLC